MNRRRLPSLALALLLVLGAGPASAALIQVTNTNDSGAGSLRAAILYANDPANDPANTIWIIVPGDGPHVISLSTALPSITKPLHFVGNWEAIDGAPGIQIDGSALASGDGLAFGTGATGSTVQYLSITGFPGEGIEINASSVEVTHSYLGVEPDGTTAAPNGTGIRVAGTSVTIGGNGAGNVISGNTGDGVTVGSLGGFSVIRGNLIGTDATGATALPNGGDGVDIGGAAGVTVGGNTTGDGNVISGNGGNGVVLSVSASFGGVQGNLIGLNASGDAALGNGGDGIWLNGHDCLVGSTDPAGRNVIAGNLGGSGILLFTGAVDDDIYGNYIGTNAAGDAAIAGQTYGIRATGTISGLTIGGTTAAHRNVISGAANWGVSMESDVSDSLVLGNYIGLNAAGTAAIPNDVGIEFGGSGNVLGGDTAGERNVISGNSGYGAILRGANNLIQGNYVGTTPAGTAALANYAGIRVVGATGGSIGGTAAGEGNLISGNTNHGISMLSETSGVTIAGNRIGTDPAGTSALANGTGIGVSGTGHTIGGATTAARNLISGNTGTGIGVSGESHVLRNNYIGVDVNGTAALANGTNGIRLYVASGVTIQENVISGNSSRGLVLDAESSEAVIVGNRVGTNAAGTAAIANGETGILLNGVAHTIGDGTVAGRNLVSGNVSSGISLRGTGHTLLGNYIGTNAAGSAALGNGGYGIRAFTISDVLIGGYEIADGNLISGNGRGISLGYGSHDVVLLNNVLGLDATASVDITTGGSGISISDSWDNTIGVPGEGNVIAGFPYEGILLSGSDSQGNVIQGNWIGTNKSLANSLGNGFAGVFATDASGNLIGGTGAGEGNVLANNYQFGVRVDRGDRNEISGNSIWGNYFGIDIADVGFFPNDGGDGDGGGNQTQNYPLLASAMVNGGSTDIDGMVISEPGTQYRIEFFSGTSCLPLGFGDGRTFRGSTLVTTDGGGQKAFSYALPQAIGDAFLTATLTDPLGNTSEFSPCVGIDQGEQPGSFQFDRGAYVGYEGVLPTTQVFVMRSLGLSGTVTVDLDTTDVSAFAGSDYTDSDQTLTFLPWEVVKVVDVPILFDPAPEAANEKLLLDLSNPTGGSSLGAQASSELQIWDYDEGYPGITVSDALVDEGDGGTTTLTFEVHLSATDHPVTVTYLVEPGTATPDVDYLADTDVLSFIPSGSPQTEIVEVQVVGDADVEADETVWLRITTASGGGTWIAYDTYGLGEIRNDDFSSPPPSDVIFADGFETGSTALWSAASPAP